MQTNEFLNLSREEFEEYIKGIYPQVWTEEFQLALLAQNDDELVRLFHYSFPNKFCDKAKNVFFETFKLDIVKEIFAFTSCPEDTYQTVVLSNDEYAKLNLTVYENDRKVIRLESKKIELTLDNCYLRGGIYKLRRDFPELAKKIYDGQYKGNISFLYIINYGTGYVVGAH